MTDRPAVGSQPCPRCGEHRDVHQTDAIAPGSNWACYKCGHTWHYDPPAQKNSDGKS